jgi:small subunit ribosomal protein S15
MARMHSKKKGKSGSKRPISRTIPKWIQYSKDEIIELILQMAKEGKNASIIGLILRDQHGIPGVKILTGKTISEILKEHNVLPKYPEDLMNLMRKAVRLSKHLAVNKQDKHNTRALRLTESKIKRLVSYYKRVKKLPSDWYYTAGAAALLVKE